MEEKEIFGCAKRGGSLTRSASNGKEASTMKKGIQSTLKEMEARIEIGWLAISCTGHPLQRFNNRAFNTTDRELIAIAAAAKIGLSKPKAASGIPMIL